MSEPGDQKTSPFLLGVTAPAKGAPRSVQLRFVRDLESRTLALSVLMFLLILFSVGSAWPIVLMMIVLIGSAAHIGWLTFAARRSAANDDQ